MSVHLALYRAQGNWINRLIRWWTDSTYSHCELVVNGVCYSSSIRDKGVRSKVMTLPMSRWDVYEIPWADEQRIVTWFIRHDSMQYGWFDLLTSQLLGMRRDGQGAFCSEACAAALGLPDPTRYSPATLADTVRFINCSMAAGVGGVSGKQ